MTLMNMTGDILCCFQTQSETLQDFEMELVNPQGPMFPHLCGGLEIRSKSHCQFVEISGYLTSLGESWNMMNLALLQNFDPGLKTFKHCLCQHWINIAHDFA